MSGLSDCYAMKSQDNNSENNVKVNTKAIIGGFSFRVTDLVGLMKG